MSKFLFGEISADETHRARGYVVISGEKGDKFVSVSTEELILWHGIVLGMTLSPLPNKEKYWQTGTVGTVTSQTSEDSWQGTCLCK